MRPDCGLACPASARVDAAQRAAGLESLHPSKRRPNITRLKSRRPGNGLSGSIQRAGSIDGVCLRFSIPFLDVRVELATTTHALAAVTMNSATVTGRSGRNAPSLRGVTTPQRRQRGATWRRLWASWNSSGPCALRRFTLCEFQSGVSRRWEVLRVNWREACGACCMRTVNCVLKPKRPVQFPFTPVSENAAPPTLR